MSRHRRSEPWPKDVLATHAAKAAAESDASEDDEGGAAAAPPTLDGAETSDAETTDVESSDAESSGDDSDAGLAVCKRKRVAGSGGESSDEESSDEADPESDLGAHILAGRPPEDVLEWVLASPSCYAAAALGVGVAQFRGLLDPKMIAPDDVARIVAPHHNRIQPPEPVLSPPSAFGEEKASTKIGAAGEEEVRKALAAIAAPSASGRAADLHAYFVGDDAFPLKRCIIIEVKKYTKTVPTKEVAKFHRDLDEVPGTAAGLFISKQSAVARTPNFSLEWRRRAQGDTVPVLFLAPASEPALWQFGVRLLTHLVELGRRAGMAARPTAADLEPLRLVADAAQTALTAMRKAREAADKALRRAETDLEALLVRHAERIELAIAAAARAPPDSGGSVAAAAAPK
jgi:hypothetical protein